MIVGRVRFAERLVRIELIDRVGERLDRDALFDVILGVDARLDVLETRADLGEDRRADELLPVRLLAEKLDLEDDRLLTPRDFGPAGAASQMGSKAMRNIANELKTTSRFKIPNLIMIVPFHHASSEKNILHTTCK